jgi:hypothetical protein
MQIKTCIKFSFLFLSLNFSRICFGQVTNIELITVDSLLTANKENLISDVNGELCSVVIINTELEGLKFYSNRGVEKIMKVENGYKVWIPAQSNIIKIIIPDFPLLEYKLPHSDFNHSIYIISLSTEKNEKVIIKDTLLPSLSIISIPTKARIILNGQDEGTSPLILKNPNFEKFEYSVYKKGYELYSSMDSMDIIIKNISVELKDISRNKRYFLTLNFKVDAFSKSPKQIDDKGLMPGILFGVFGKTGFYSSLNFLYINTDPASPASYDNYTRYNKVRKTSASIGINQQLHKSLFIYGGPGYTNRAYQEGEESTFKSESLSINTGIILRLSWKYLIQFDYGKSLTDSYSSLGFGLGYNFFKPIN